MSSFSENVSSMVMPLGRFDRNAVHGERVVQLALHALEHGAQERRLAIDATEVTRWVIGKSVGSGVRC